MKSYTMRFLSLALALMLGLSLFIPALAADASQFSDVSENYWAKDEIAACASLGIVNGYNGKFNPDDPVTGVQFASMLTRTFYGDELTEIETPEGQPWYYPNITAAENLGISDITLTFQDNPISRYDMARALYNIIAKNNKLAPDIEAGNAASKIKDYTSIPTNRRVAVCQCYALGILSGMTDGTFSGEQSMTRAQACAVIVRMLNLIGGGEISPAPVPPQEQEPAETPEQEPEQTETPPQTDGGTLANGKPITTENVLEIMEEIQAQYPKGTAYLTPFCTSGHAGDVTDLIHQWITYDGKTVNVNTGCAGYARMVSNTIFGETGFPARKVNNPTPSNVRPGDIIIEYTDSNHTRIQHVSIVWKTAQYDGVWYFSGTGNSSNGGVSWPTGISGSKFSDTQAVYTRYPE